MERVSSTSAVDDLQFNIRRQQEKISSAQQGIAKQSRIRDLRDDPTAAAHASRYQTRLVHLERFSKNIERAIDRRELAEQYVREGIDIIQRTRELAVQTANGIYTENDRAYAASEVEELLQEFISIANARDADGTTLFSGYRSRTDAFRVLYGTVDGGREAVTSVEYNGSIGQNETSISNNATVPLDIRGNELFWAEQNQVFSSQEAVDYRITEASSFSIDGHIIQAEVGDTLSALVAKINSSGAAVNAAVDPVVGSLTLETTVPHQLWLKDEDGTVLSDLGIINGNRAPYNIADSAQNYTASIFDSMIAFRDSLLSNDVEAVGSSNLKSLDASLESLAANITKMGAVTERLRLAYKRNEFEIPEVTDMHDKEAGLDIAEAVTNMKMLDFAYQATISSAARILQPSLLDYLQ